MTIEVKCEIGAAIGYAIPKVSESCVETAKKMVAGNIMQNPQSTRKRVPGLKFKLELNAMGDI